MSVVPETLDAAVDILYAVPPGEFVARRTELVSELKSSGAKSLAAQVSKLRAPTIAAWAMNHLVRVSPGHAEGVGSAGRLLREAQATLDSAQLRALRPQREAVLTSFVDAAVSAAAEAGVELRPAARDDIRDTLVAALAVPDVEEVVLSGRLVKTVVYSGLGEVDLGEVVTRSERPAQPSPASTDAGESGRRRRGQGGAGSDGADAESVERERAERDAAERERAERDAAERERAERDAAERQRQRADAEAAVLAAEERLTAASLTAAQAAERAEAQARRVNELRALLTEAEAQAEEAKAAADAAEDARSAARQTVDEAVAERDDLSS